MAINAGIERMRVALLGSFLVDYTIKVATPLNRHAEVLVIADDRVLARDVTLKEVDQYVSTGGRLRTFRQARIWNRWWSVVVVLVILLRFRPHVLVAHEHAHPHLTWIMRSAALFSKLLLIVHDPIPHTGQDATFAEANRRSTLMQRQLATAFVVHGHYCARSLVEQLGVADSRTIHPIRMGANFGPDKPAHFTRRGRLLMFGRMEYYKGLQLLVEACEILCNRGLTFDLRIAGRGPELERLAERFLALGCCTIESKFISREAALREFADADLLVAPYLEATQSGVVALAFASGRPVVATKVGGLADFVKHEVNGLLVPPNSPRLLADALERMLIEVGLVEQLARGAEISGQGDHSWAAIGDSMWQAIVSTSR